VDGDPERRRAASESQTARGGRRREGVGRGNGEVF